MKTFYVLSIISLFISCHRNKVDNPAYFEIVEQYRGALDTFFDYVDILNDNELNEKNLSSLFSEKFSISLIGNPNLTFQNISDFTKF